MGYSSLYMTNLLHKSLPVLHKSLPVLNTLVLHAPLRVLHDTRRYFIGYHPYLMVAEPDAIQEVLVKKFDNFRNRGVSCVHTHTQVRTHTQAHTHTQEYTNT